MRAVVDANVFVSAALTPSGPPGRGVTALRREQFDVVTSAPLVEEVASVLRRPRLIRRYPAAATVSADLVTLLREQGALVTVTGSVQVCRDPKDDMVIETAIKCRADVLVSRDDDLKRSPEVAVYLEQHGIQVLTVQRFLDALARESTE